jgi:methyl-accepting chemotaxis protein-1 (serine sensor receptor)
MTTTNMPLGRRLLLAVGLAMTVAVGAGVAGVEVVSRSAAHYAAFVATEVAAQADAMAIRSDFQSQVQEWKNTLLRGKDPEQAAKYWKAFEKNEAAVQKAVKDLVQRLPAGEQRELASRFQAAHASMGQKYRGAYEAFRAADGDAAVGDKAVRGLDREPTQVLDKLVEQLNAAIAQGSRAAEKQRQQAYAVTLGALGVALLLGLAGAAVIARRVTRELGGEPADARDAARRIAAGDLVTPVPVRPGDTTTLFAALQDMQRALADIVGRVREGSESVSVASSQIAQGNADLSGRTEEQASALQETAATMDELGSTVRNTADNAQQANQLAQAAATLATAGGDVVGKVVSTMENISDSSRRIGDIIGVIDGIAFQTNILALNAAVEAARAGEQGRGFAVVAGEVRTLAQRSAEAAREIKALIGRNVEQVGQGANLVDEAGRTMTEIVDAIRRVSDIVSEITAATVEQSSGVQQVGDAVTQIDQVTQQNAALVEQSAAAAESLKAQAQQLVQAVSVFQLAGGERSTARAPGVPARPSPKAGGGAGASAGKAASRVPARPRAAAPGPALAAAPAAPATAASAAPAAASAPRAATASAGDRDDWAEF